MAARRSRASAASAWPWPSSIPTTSFPRRNPMDHHVIEGFRLSPQQSELFDTGSAATQVAQAAVLLEGALDRERLIAALHDVVRRHEILRTRFQHLPGMTTALQVISGEPVVEIELR